jgi:ACR3 family arsenite efflux pump ArsB
MLVNEYKLYVSIQKSSKDAKFGQSLYLGIPLVMSRTDAQNGVDIIFKLYIAWNLRQKKFKPIKLHCTPLILTLVILFCLMADDFTHQGESAGAQ